ncbi:cysteine dioxygenase [Streptomyces avicenniae]|uniref:cysteine dioxygenase n=1 Tax=Streptomyces avicenniae TaxID=500153 RepID=UPI00069C6A8A|nr:cysteine dioxygenase family protein [Streptomyces avicenniae]
MTAPSPAVLTPTQLASTAREFAARTELWRPATRFTADRRWYQRLERADDFEVWLLTWLPGQGTEIHNHGGSSGAFTVVEGTLTERSFGDEPVPRTLDTGQLRSFGPTYVHEVTNNGDIPAVSIHAYGPALTVQSFFAWDGALRLLRTEAVDD